MRLPIHLSGVSASVIIRQKPRKQAENKVSLLKLKFRNDEKQTC